MFISYDDNDYTTGRGKEWCPPLHLGVEAIKKGAFWSPLNTVANFTLLQLNIKPLPKRSLRGVVANVLHGDTVVSEFKLQ